MKKRKIATFLFAPFFMGTVSRRAFGSSVGFLIGLLPIGYWIWVAAAAIAFLLQLNLVAIIVGMALSLAAPMLEFLVYQIDPIWGEMLHENIFLKLVVAIVGMGIVYFTLKRWYDDQISDESNEHQFVFADNGKRWYFLKRALMLLSIMAVGTLCMFAISLWIKPDISPYVAQPESEKRIPVAKEEVSSYFAQNNRYIKKLVSPLPKANLPTNLPVYAFYTPWDGNAYEELNDRKHIKQVDVLIPKYYSFSSLDHITIDRDGKVDQLAKANDVKVIPILSDQLDDPSVAETLHQLLRSKEKQLSLIQTLISDEKQHGYKGINLSFQQVQKKDKKAFRQFVKQLTSSFHQAGLQVILTLPINHPGYDDRTLSKLVDACILTLPANRQSKDFNTHIKELSRLPIPANKRIVTIETSGYDQIVDSSRPAEPITFLEAMRRASQSHLPIYWDKHSSTPYTAYRKTGRIHLLTFPDATTVWNQLYALQPTAVSGIALPSIGQEDEQIWGLLHRSPRPSHLEKMSFSSPIYRGEGGIIHTVQQPKIGYRKVTFHQDRISNVIYTSLPSPMVIQKYGVGHGKQIALTFDDGPDGDYTPDILDILAHYQIKASFYVVGGQIIKYPNVFRRLVAEKHDIGNHTFSHSPLHLISDSKANFELKANLRLVQALTGHTMNTFRAPYIADSEPYAPLDLKPVGRGERAGYTMIGEQIDPTDWKEGITAEQIVRGVLDQLDYGNIILLHDAGGNREQTVQALPTIIEELQKRGYEFVTIDQLIGKSYQGFPLESIKDDILRPFGLVVFTFLSLWQNGLTYLMYAVILLGIFRIVSFLFLSSRQKRKAQKRSRANPVDFQPKVSIVIAAYNEEEVINKTIRSVLESTYPSLEIIIVNDGSTDRTEAVIKEAFVTVPQVHLITKRNGGKTAAVNLGFQHASGEIVVCIDADTLIHRNAISYMVSHFHDSSVAAVSGNVKVGNVSNLLTLWQHVEYVTGFNLERRAFDQLNAIPVVPGAIGAWRKQLVAEVGYFQEDTLAEDTDLTINLLRGGYNILYESRALAYTEAPEQVGGFVKQRTRWIYGTLQSLWKHRGALFSGNQKGLGFVSLPNMWIFQYGVQLVSPFIDVLFFFSLFTPYAKTSLLFYLSFLLFDYITAFYSFRLEKEGKKPLIWLFVQRFVYRQLMTFVVARSLYYALKGISVGWNKLKRSGNLRMEGEEKEIAIEAS